MKKFSFLLIGAFLLGTITFALAEEAANTATGDTAEVAAETTAAEAATGDTAEVVAETTAAEAATGDTAEVAAETTAAEATTGDAAEVAAETTATETTATETTDSDKVESTETISAEENTPTVDDSAKSKYSEEQIKAYEWALENGITTINDIEKARLTDGLTRAELAKMMSQYMTKVMGKTPVDAEKVNYTDVNSSLGDLADFIQTAYAYKIMGINADGTPLKKFNPRGKVTRAEYATVFSRVLFGDKYNKSEGNYYDAHLEALKEAEILTNTTPNIQEVRGWVMLMMYRSSQNSGAIEKVANATEKEETSVTTGEVATGNAATTEEGTGKVEQIANPASEYCVAQGGTVNIVKDAEGNESGICKLADGTEVDEWEYYRANNPATEETTTDEVTTEKSEETTTEQPSNTESVEALTGDTATTTETSDKE